jgi:hypothetical protein
MELNASIRDIPMPERIARLPISPTGFPVPWFVAWFDVEALDGTKSKVPDFRVVDTPKLAIAHNRKRCWVCGDRLGRQFAMTIGPMCAISRVISEPPSHRECAIYAALACPFLANPRMRRNEKGLPVHREAAGNGIRRNPGAMAVWITRSYRPLRVSNGSGVLFTFEDEPEEVLWFAEGRTATRAEVVHSIDTGIHLLVEEAEKQGPPALAALTQQIEDVQKYLPAA